MKITQLREKDGNLTLSTTDLDTFLQKIKTETKTQPVSTFRQQLRYCLPGKRCNEADRLPKVLPAAEFRKTNGVCQMKTYNGIVELTVGPLSGKSEIALVKRLAWEQPQTRLVFTGSSGRTVKIWTTFTRPNNSLPGKREEAEEAIIMLFEAALQKTFAEATGAGADNSLHSLTVRLAENCFRSGIPEEETVKRTYFHYYLRQKETVIRQIVRSVYQENKGFNTQSSLSKEQRLAIQTDEFMKRRYDFRYNTQVGEVEYRERHSFRFRFSPIDKRTLNSIALDAQSEGIPLWDRDISRYIYSNRIPVFNPLEDYLYDLPHWDGKDRILALAQTVPCNNPYWAELFHRWFLNMVAHWRGNTDKKYANSVSPLLVGAQGTRKSTFCRSIVPPELRAYYTDSIDFSRKRDAELYLNRFALINIDEFDQISSTQQGFLKHILQKPVVNVRKPYANAVLEMRRYASFIATSNQKDLLTDPSGSRRFICIEVTEAIDTNRPIDYNQLYTQAMHELDHGERYWFDQSDERIMTENNHDFEQIPPEEQLFYHYFRVAGNDEEGEWLSSAEILNRLRRYSAIPLSTKRVNVFGRILQKHEVPSRRTRFGTLYHVVECKRQED